MKFIDESIVNATLDAFEDDALYLESFKEMLSTEPELTVYLDPGNYSLLNGEELALLEYITCVLYHSVKRGLDRKPVIFGSILEKHEELNWDVVNESNNKNFSKVLDKFFKGHPQEDLLALVEDAIVSDEDNPVTIVGAEIIFVTCKSIIDTMHELN